MNKPDQIKSQKKKAPPLKGENKTEANFADLQKSTIIDFIVTIIHQHES